MPRERSWLHEGSASVFLLLRIGKMCVCWSRGGNEEGRLGWQKGRKNERRASEDGGRGLQIKVVAFDEMYSSCGMLGRVLVFFFFSWGQVEGVDGLSVYPSPPSPSSLPPRGRVLVCSPCRLQARDAPPHDLPCAGMAGVHNRTQFVYVLSQALALLSNKTSNSLAE